jgi:site-specific DNA-methyltransferase (adenine-specific)
MSNMCNDKEKIERGKKPTDTWWFSIVGTNSSERTGYPTQKPEKLLERIIKTHSNQDDMVLDFFAGSGTSGKVCEKLKRNCILCDINPQAIDIMKKRFGDKAIYR